MTWTWAWHWLRFLALTLGGAATLFIVGLIAIEAVRLRGRSVKRHSPAG